MDHARRIGDDFSFAKSVTYEFDEGYVMRDNPEIFCTRTVGWRRIGSPAHCEKIVYDPPDHGRVRSDGEWAEYSSDAHHRLVGGSRRRNCMANRTWSDEAPRRWPITCKVPPATIANGRVMAGLQEDGVYPEDHLINVQCGPIDSGIYRTVRFKTNGFWTQRFDGICSGDPRPNV